MADIGNTGLTALAGGGKTGATALSYGINRISVCATALDSVQLPLAVAGQVVRVINAGAQACNVFPNTTDTISGLATTLGVSQAPGAIVEYTCALATTVTGTPPVTTSGNWETSAAGAIKAAPITVTASGAFNPHVSAIYVLNKAGVSAMTLAAPTATTDDGVIIQVTSDSAQAHTLTATSLLDTGTANVTLATFAAQKGAGVTLMAFNARWKVMSSVGITFS